MKAAPQGDLLADIHANMVEAFASLPPHLPGTVLERGDGIVLAITGSRIPLFNSVLPLADRVDPAALRAACDTVRAARLPWTVQLRDDVHGSLVPVALELGLEESSELSWPAMALTALPSEVSLPDGLEIRRVVDAAGYEDHLRAAGGDPATGRTWMGAGIVDDPRWALFVGYFEGVPVAKSMSFAQASVVGVYNVSTLGAFRRRGFGSALTTAALVAGREKGCAVGTLQSSAMACGLYEALGFRKQFRYRTFTGPAAP